VSVSIDRIAAALAFLALLLLVAGSSPATDGAIRITSDPADDKFPDWSPDGSHLVFESDRTGNSDLFVIPSTGGLAVQVTTDTCYDGRAVWSPAGSDIAFETDRGLDTVYPGYPVCDIYVIPATGGTATQITTWHRYDERPDWSPDGTHIVFTSDRGDSIPGFSCLGLGLIHPAEIFKIPVTGEPATRLTFHPDYENDPVWSPDGTQLAFRADYYLGNWDIWVMPASGGYGERLTYDPAVDDTPTWSPDGEQIAFQSDRSGNWDIWAISADGGTPIQITTDPAADWGPSWSPDGTQIAFHSSRGGNWDIYTIAVPNSGIIDQEGTTWGRIKSIFR
jgi:Tol biopolymer transport system component